MSIEFCLATLAFSTQTELDSFGELDLKNNRPTADAGACRLEACGGSSYHAVVTTRLIRLRGVRVHNLRNVDLDIPHGQLLSLCGVSGSGKSSLAFDTLYAEGQRRYIESLSPSTRQFLQRLDKPEADLIDGIPPAVAVRAQRGTPSPRSTVGTATEIVEYLRLLFVKLGQLHCPNCQRSVDKHHPESVANQLSQLPAGTRFQIVFESQILNEDLMSMVEQLGRWRESGFTRVAIEGTTYDLHDLSAIPRLTNPVIDVLIIVDRLAVGQSKAERVRDSLESAFAYGDGKIAALIPADPPGGMLLDGRHWRAEHFSNRLRCGHCDQDFPDPQPGLFSFSNALGACPRCEGFGSIQEVDRERVFPDLQQTITEGAIAPFNTPAYEHQKQKAIRFSETHSIPVDRPLSELTDNQIQALWDGDPETDFQGIGGFFEWLSSKRYQVAYRTYLSRWQSRAPCPECHQSRLNPLATSFQLAGKNIVELCSMEVCELAGWLESISIEDWQFRIAKRGLQDISQRLGFLIDVGLGYLSLDRSLPSLSGGETQRVALTTCLGSTLVNLMYVLDEPSAGLHQHDVSPSGGVDPVAARSTEYRGRGGSRRDDDFVGRSSAGNWSGGGRGWWPNRF